jgi:hypothetical protein
MAHLFNPSRPLHLVEQLALHWQAGGGTNLSRQTLSHRINLLWSHYRPNPGIAKRVTHVADHYVRCPGIGSRLLPRQDSSQSRPGVTDRVYEVIGYLPAGFYW